jgi:hypothetical protein
MPGEERRGEERRGEERRGEERRGEPKTRDRMELLESLLISGVPCPLPFLSPSRGNASPHICGRSSNGGHEIGTRARRGGMKSLLVLYRPKPKVQFSCARGLSSQHSCHPSQPFRSCEETSLGLTSSFVGGMRQAGEGLGLGSRDVKNGGGGGGGAFFKRVCTNQSQCIPCVEAWQFGRHCHRHRHRHRHRPRPSHWSSAPLCHSAALCLSLLALLALLALTGWLGTGVM